MKTLHLNLKKKWFDMILSGEKKQEYREIKKYWINRLLNLIWHNSSCPLLPELCNDYDVLSAYLLSFKKFDTITFSNGFTKNRRQFEIKLDNIIVRDGISEWGAENNIKYFVLNLGEIVQSNCS